MRMNLYFTIQQFNRFQSGETAFAKAKDELTGMHPIIVSVDVDEVDIEELSREDLVTLHQESSEYLGDIKVTRRASEETKNKTIDV